MNTNIKYYPSNYNFITTCDGMVILYNSKSGKLVNLGLGNYSDYACLIKNNSEIKINSDILKNYLIKNKFIVQDPNEEFNDVISMYDEVVNSNELFLEILPTEKCNFRCIYCYETYDREPMCEETLKGIVSFVKSRIKFSNSLKVAWFGGEPLLSMDILEKLSRQFIEICNTEHIPYYSSITTNGYLLTPENWSKLKKSHVTDFQISIDGLENTHDRQRILANGRETWNTIINNLRYFRDNIKTKTTNIILRTNITKEIYLQRNEYIDFLKKEFSCDERFNFFFHLAQDWGNLKDEKIKEEFCGINEFYEILELAANKGLSLKVFRYFLSPAGRVCFAGKNNSFVISPDGNIRKCSFRLNDNNNLLANVENYNTNLFHEWEYFYCSKKIKDDCLCCKKLPLCYGLVCPSYPGNVKETCGYDISDIERLIKILSISDKKFVDKIM